MEIVGECLGIDQDKQIWQFFKENCLDYFPQIPQRTTFTRQAANLSDYRKGLSKVKENLEKKKSIIQGLVWYNQKVKKYQ